MKVQKLILILICICGMMTSCVIKTDTKPVILDVPASPSLTVYTTPPIIRKTDEGFLVTNEGVENFVSLTDYYKRIEAWKEKKNIR